MKIYDSAGTVAVVRGTTNLVKKALKISEVFLFSLKRTRAWNFSKLEVLSCTLEKFAGEVLADVAATCVIESFFVTQKIRQKII